MNAGIYHQPNCPPDLTGQTAKIRVRILKATHFLRQPLRIKTPSFCVCSRSVLCAEPRYFSQFLLNGNLHVMARVTLMIGNVFNLPFGQGRHITHVGIEHAGSRAIRRALTIVLGSPGLFPK